MFTTHKLQGAGGVGGDIEGVLVEYAYSTRSSTITLSSSPQAGDLLVLHTGGYAFAHTQDAAFTLVVSKNSTAWSGSYFESSKISYKIATGSEGTAITTVSGNFDMSSVLAVYRFTRPVSSISVAFSASQQGPANRNITISGYSKPNVVVCSVGSYGNPSMSLTDQNYSYRSGYISAASSLTNAGSTTSTSVISATNVNFNEACTYAVLVPNF